MERWQGWRQQAAGRQQPGFLTAIIIINSSSSHVQSAASPPLQTQTFWGQRSWTWPYGPQENVHRVWGIIWDLFRRRPYLGQHYASLSSVFSAHRARLIGTLFYLHLYCSTINTADSIIYLNTPQPVLAGEHLSQAFYKKAIKLELNVLLSFYNKIKMI